jgi:hypothetical protein
MAVQSDAGASVTQIEGGASRLDAPRCSQHGCSFATGRRHGGGNSVSSVTIRLYAIASACARSSSCGSAGEGIPRSD